MIPMIPCVLESPFAGDVERNTEYARQVMRDLLKAGYAPFASHLLYTQPGVLDDNDWREREVGIEAGLAIAELLPVTVVAMDRGVSKGMQYGIARAEKAGRRIMTYSTPGRLQVVFDENRRRTYADGVRDAMNIVEAHVDLHEIHGNHRLSGDRAEAIRECWKEIKSRLLEGENE